MRELLQPHALATIHVAEEAGTPSVESPVAQLHRDQLRLLVALLCFVELPYLIMATVQQNIHEYHRHLTSGKGEVVKGETGSMLKYESVESV